MALGTHEIPPSPAEVMDWRNQNHVFERIAVFGAAAYDLSGQGEPERIGAARVTADLFPVLGIEPVRGRVFTAEEDEPGKGRVVVVSYGLWQRRFGGDPGLVGQSITLDNESFTVVGIMPAGFQFPGAEFPARYADRSDLWTPLAFGPDGWRFRYRTNLAVIGRLKPGVSLSRARAEMSAIAPRLAQDYPNTNGGWTLWLTPLREQSVGRIRLLLVVLLGAVVFVLLMALELPRGRSFTGYPAIAGRESLARRHRRDIGAPTRTLGRASADCHRTGQHSSPKRSTR